MTLSRQLITLILITFLLIFSGTFWISVENTRSYLMLQLETQTQNAADSLGLSLVPHLRERDIAAMDTMINAVFDSGYYKSLKLQRMSGEMLIERENTSRIEGVPDWFIHNLTLDTPVAESVITTGWTQAGLLRLEAHPGFAYKKLWETSIAMLWWSLLAFIAALAATLLVLKAILRPLDAVERQALAISEREFPVVDDIPRTRELQRVVLAMNRMASKLESFINKLSKRAEQMRQQAHYDALTGLINRHGFDARLESILKDREKGGSGALAIIRMNNLAAVNKAFGHVAGNELLASTGKLLEKLAEQHHHATAARITGTDFALILPLADEQVAYEFGKACSAGLNELAATLQADDIARIGISSFNHNMAIGDVMANTDAALALAEHEGANAHAVQWSSSSAAGNEAWRALIVESIECGNVQLMAQTVVDSRKTALYSEAFIRIRDHDGNAIAPAPFASMAERLELNSTLDRHVVELATQALEQDASLHLGINVAARSIRDESFCEWLQKHLTANADAASRICFEVTEQGMLQDIAQANRFIELAHQHSCMVVMEHFGTRLSAFKTLQQLKVDYIKLDGSYIRNLSENSDNRFFLQTVSDIAHGLDIKVIAEHVETEEEFATLRSLGINAMQGYYFGEPQALS